MSITTTNKGKGVMAHITIVLINPVSLEFTVAQSPVHSRGMMVGVWYATWLLNNFAYLIATIRRFVQVFIKAFLLNILTVFVILAKHYKYHVRENEVNIHQIMMIEKSLFS